MSIVGFLRGYYYRFARGRTERQLAAQPPAFSLDRTNWTRSLTDPNGFYVECLRYFLRDLPPELREHRTYFQNPPQNRRGFGESPFHVLWFLLLREFRPANFLEIGVFRGQVISLVSLLARMNGNSCQVHGISPFSPAGDSVSKYSQDVDYYQDTLVNFDHFRLPPPTLLRAYSTDPAAVQLIDSKVWDLIYIDGNHDYNVARKDWEACSRKVKRGGLIVLDDAGITTSYQPPPYLGTRGHPGPSRLAQEIDCKSFAEVLQVGHNRVFQKL
jgi:predicted O-methyltransferase YrrM